MDISRLKTLWGPGELLDYELKRASTQPGEIPGDVIEDVLIPARGYLPARLVTAGDVMRFIDIEGQQVADIILYDPNNLKNLSSMNNTTLINRTWKITTGHSFYAKFGQRMATIINDTVGTNGAAGSFCSSELNRVRYGIEGTHSCRINLTASMSAYNFAPADIEEGCCSLFMNVSYKPDGGLELLPPISKPGDHLDLRADMDIVVAISNCPSEHNAVNAWNPTPLRVVIYHTS